MLSKKTQNNILFSLLLLTSVVTAQQVYVGLGIATAEFNEYVNSFGENTLEDSGFSKSQEPLIESGFRFDLYKKRIGFDVGVNYNKYKINTSFYSGNITIPTTYNLSYVSVNGGFNVSVIRWKRIKLQIHSHLSYDWLTFGTNEYRDVFVDLYKEKTLDRTLFRFHRGLGLEYKISDKISIYSSYNHGTSFKEENQDSTDGEKYELNTKAITIGLLFEIGKKKKKKVQTPKKETE